jgi:PAS domain S-box-containing protein
MSARIRAFDWSKTPLGAIEAWPQSLRTAVQLMLDSGFPCSIHLGPQAILLYNDASAPILGDLHPDALGRPLFEVLTAGAPIWAPVLRHVMAGGSMTLGEQSHVIRSQGVHREIWVDHAASPLRDETGAVAGLWCVSIDITHRKQAQTRQVAAEAALREEEARKAYLLELSDALSPLADPAEVNTAAARLLGERLGANRALYFEIDGGEIVVHGDHVCGAASMAGRHPMEVFGPALIAALKRGEDFVVGGAANDPRLDAGDRAALSAARADACIGMGVIRNEQLVAGVVVHAARPRGWSPTEIALARDTAARTWAAVRRARAETALQQSELRLQTLIEGVPQLVWRAGEAGAWTWASPQWTALTGQTEAESHGFGWLQPVHPRDRDAALGAWRRAAASGMFQADYRIFSAAEKRYRWHQSRALPVRDAHDAIVAWLGASMDVEDLRALQERQKVLVAELQHRTRNLMAVVRSISEQTVKGSSSLPDFKLKFRDRMDALARVQGLLSRLRDGERITFDELIREELSALGALDGPPGRVTLDGPPGVALRSSMVQIFAMALHELATNAAKYGALNQPEGRLSVRWRLEEGEDGAPWLQVDWRESGVVMPPPGAAPKGGGQGRELIEHALPYQLGGKTSFVMAPDGVHCLIALPVSRRHTIEDPSDDRRLPA